MFNRVFIATFSFRVKNKRTAINGMIEPLLQFFLPRASQVDLLDSTHPGSSTVLTFFEHYENKKLVNEQTSLISRLLYPILIISNTNSTQILFKVRDLLSVIELGIRRRKKKYDIFIGLESVFTLGGIMLKKLGIVSKVVYYVSDYSPYRYSNKLLNNIYLSLDRFCCYHADCIWDVSPVMLPARIKAGLDIKRIASHVLVPNALYKDQISYLSLDKLEHYSLVFVGTLGPENGPQVAVSALPIIIKKFPKTKLHIIGGNDDFEEPLKQLVKNKKLENHVVFHGFISNAVEVSKCAQKFMVGLAPYTALPDSPRWYADATKIRLYFGIGLPVITTHVPPLGREVEEKGAGIIVKDSEQELASAVIRLFSNKNMYKKMREAAIKFAKNNTWENSYENAIKALGNLG